MAIIISRSIDGKPVKETELSQFSLTDNPLISQTINTAMMRMNQEGKPDGKNETKGSHLY